MVGPLAPAAAMAPTSLLGPHPSRAPPAALSPSQAFFRRYHRPPAPRAASTGAAAAPSPAAPAPTASPSLDLDTLLNYVHAASCCLPTNRPSAVTVISGTGQQLGMEVAWRVSFRADGAFREEVASPFVSFYSGYDGVDGSAAWDVDSSGVCHSLELDDHEASLLGAWARAGVWAAPALRGRLEMELVYESEAGTAFGEDFDSGVEAMVAVRLRLRGGRVTATVGVEPGSWRAVAASVAMSGDRETWRFLQWREWGTAADSGNGNGSGAPVLPCPARFVHESLNGGQHELSVAAVEAAASPAAVLAASSALLGALAAAAAAAAEFTCPFTAPPQPLLPTDASFDETATSTVPVWFSSSGHVLVRADVGATPAAGFFILDTGASGFVVEPTAADSLGLEAFGEVHITGMAGKVKGQFRRASSFKLGPLVIKDAVMMQMACSGLVTGGPGPVIGIVGYEIFRRAVVDVPPMVLPKTAKEEAREAEAAMSPAAALAFAALPKPKQRPRRLSAESGSDEAPPPHAYITLLHPERAGEVLESFSEEEWMPVTLLSSLPHISVSMSLGKEASSGGSAGSDGGSDGAAKKSALLMVDTGAGGMSAMLNARAAAELGLGVTAGGRTIRGVGGSAAASVTLKTASIGALEVGGARFEGVQCLVSPEGAGGGVALSHYSAGILCGEVLSKCRLVMDLPRRRMAVLPGRREENGAAEE